MEMVNVCSPMLFIDLHQGKRAEQEEPRKKGGDKNEKTKEREEEVGEERRNQGGNKKEKKFKRAQMREREWTNISKLQIGNVCKFVTLCSVVGQRRRNLNRPSSNGSIVLIPHHHHYHEHDHHDHPHVHH
jgi:hypothetical protein